MFALQPVTARDEEWVSKAPAAVAVGEPRSCINANLIRSTDVHDARTIDFEMTGGKVYRNTLPYSCSALTYDRAFSYRRTTSQLCSVDIITPLRTTGGSIEGWGGCGLGKFQQVELVKEDGGAEGQ